MCTGLQIHFFKVKILTLSINLVGFSNAGLSRSAAIVSACVLSCLVQSLNMHVAYQVCPSGTSSGLKKSTTKLQFRLFKQGDVAFIWAIRSFDSCASLRCSVLQRTWHSPLVQLCSQIVRRDSLRPTKIWSDDGTHYFCINTLLQSFARKPRCKTTNLC